MTKKCPVCGKEFETENHQRKYCSVNCLSKHNKEYQKQYRKDNQKYLRIYQRNYYREHHEEWNEYQRKYRRERKAHKRVSSYPCTGIPNYSIPTEMCLNCNAPECRFYND